MVGIVEDLREFGKLIDVTQFPGTEIQGIRVDDINLFNACKLKRLWPASFNEFDLSILTFERIKHDEEKLRDLRLHCRIHQSEIAEALNKLVQMRNE